MTNTTPTPELVAWRLSDDDHSTQAYIRMSTSVSARVEQLRLAPLASDPTELRQQATTLQHAFPRTTTLNTWALDHLVDARTTQDLINRLRGERDLARADRDAFQASEARLLVKLEDAEKTINRLASAIPNATNATPRDRDRTAKIVDPDKFDGSRDKLKAFKDQLMLAVSGNQSRFPNLQHRLRYAYQFLTGKAQRTMRIHLRKVTTLDGEETYEVSFDSFAAFLAALERHFGDPDEKHTASVALDRLRQGNREFNQYYADFQELMDILDHMDDASRRHALTRGLSNEMQDALAIYPAPEDESLNQYIIRLNALDCRLRARQNRKNNHHNHSHNQNCRHSTSPPSSAVATTATGTAAGPMDLSATRGPISAAERARRRAKGLCMYCGGTGHFAAECPLRAAPAGRNAGTPGPRTPARRAIAGAVAAVTPGHVSDLEDSDSEPEASNGASKPAGKGKAQE